MQLYLSPLALSYLAQLLLTLCIAFYLAHLHIWRTGQSGTENRLPRQRDSHASLLACFFAALAGFVFTLFLEAVLPPTERLYAVFVQNTLLGAALVCLLQFAYHFPQPSAALRREARLALVVSVLYALGEAGYALFRFFQLRGGVIEYRPNWSDYFLLLLFLWIPVALVRQIGALREHEGGWRARYVMPLLRPTNRAASALRAFILIFLFVAGLNLFNILRAVYLLPVALANLGISLGILMALFAFAVVYLNHRPETTSFMVKLVGVTLTVMLALLGVVGWVISPTYEAYYRPHLPDRRTLRFMPNDRGGYSVVEIPFAWRAPGGDRLSLAEDAARTCSPPIRFDFDFYGQRYTQVYACNDGTLSMGQQMQYRMYQYRYGAGVPLIMALLTDLYPEISEGGVWASAEAGQLTVTWERLRGFKQQDLEFTFQATLYNDGIFELAYDGLPAQLAFSSNDDPGASLWAVGALPGGLSGAGPQVVSLAMLPLDGGPEGILHDYLLEFRHHVHQLFAPLAWLILGASALIIVGFPLLFYASLVSPLNALLQGVQRLEAGEYDLVVPVRYADEIGFLTGAFNNLAARLGDLIHNLEARVVARTQELDEANAHLRAEITEREQAQATVIEQQRSLAMLEERERLGRDLHDGLGQMLGYINVEAQTVETMLIGGQVEPAQVNLRHIVETAQEAHDDIRRYILGLRAGDTPRQDFWAAVRDYLRQFQTTYGIETRLSLPDDAPNPAFAPAVESQLLHIIQEALTNVRKHAAAQRVEVLFNFAPTTTHVIVVDDGCGFETDQQISESSGAFGSHFGLDMMRERAKNVGGQVEIRSAPGQGTCVLVYVPRLASAALPDAGMSDLVELRLLLVDDHPLFLEGLRNLLTARGFTVVGVARDGESALQQARTLRPDVVVMDVHMPGVGGLEATRAIKDELPQVKIVMLTVAEDDAHLFEAISSGASGYLLKSLDADRFCNLLTNVLRGDMPLSPGMAARIMSEFSRQSDREAPADVADLTPRQQEVLSLVAQGLIYKEVAERLHLSEKTIKYHMGQIVEKLQVENRAQAIASYSQQIDQQAQE